MSENLKRGMDALDGVVNPLAKLDERYIGYFDILGFSEVVKNNPPEMLERIYDQFYNISLINVSSHPMKTGSFDGVQIATADLSDVIVNMFLVSDSIVLWSEDISINSFHKMLIVMSRFLINGLRFKYPLRGALTKGLFAHRSMEENTNLSIGGRLIYGPGLVAAVDLEKEQNWAGCVIDENCLEYYDELVRNSGRRSGAGINELEAHNWVIKYAVPSGKRNKLVGL